MRPQYELVPLLMVALCVASCAPGNVTRTPPSSSTTVTAVSVTATPSSVTTAQTATCSATVAGTGSYSSAVTWSATGGTITSAGVFTPSASAGNASCIANSAQAGYTNVSGSAKITVTVVPPTITAVTLVCNPSTITNAQTTSCTPTVTGTGAFANTVNLSVSPAGGGTFSASSGIDSGTAVTFTPTSTGAETATITATSTADATKTGQAVVAVTLSGAAPTITAVTLVCNPSTITNAQTTSCTPTVTGTGAFANTVNLSLSPSGGGTFSASSGIASGTAVTFTPSSTGAETATITATSTADATKTGQAIVTVTLAGAAPTCGGMSLGDNASLNGFVPFPSTFAWNTNIANAQLDPNNTTITTAAGFAGLHLHHDFSSVAGGNYGIPYVVVDSGSTPLVSLDIVAYANQSDVADAPFPATAPIEGDPGNCVGGPSGYVGDQHVLVLDRNRCMLYETFNSTYCNGGWSADSETIWDMQSSEMRPWGWTSADAAGLSVFEGLIRYDEVAAGAINHAIRFTMEKTKNDANDGYFVEPATHAAGNTWGVSNVMGMRIRLKSSFDISGYSTANQVILKAMQQYGMILADNGGYFFFQGVPDPRWDDNDLRNLDSIQSSNFEVVQMTPTFPGWDSNSAPTGNPPTINSFVATPSTVAAGGTVTLAWTTTNDSYDFIDKLGGVHGGSVTIAPTATTTYTLTATNQYGPTTAQVTVTVH